MPNIAALLKQEITRLSRKEVRAAVEPLKKQIATLRHDAAALKRANADLQRAVASLAKARNAEAPAATSAGGTSTGRMRITAKGIQALRSKLGLSADKLALLVGASGQSVYAWESGVQPRKAQAAKLIELRGLGKKEVASMLDKLAPPAKSGKKASKRRGGG